MRIVVTLVFVAWEVFMAGAFVYSVAKVIDIAATEHQRRRANRQHGRR